MTAINTKKQDALSIEDLKKTLHYSPDTGVFIRKIRRGPHKSGSVAGYHHHHTGYVHIIIYGIEYLAHRLAFFYMTERWPENQIDHINHIRNDNRWINIRETTYQGNNKNVSLSSRNTSGFLGVSWDKRNKKWISNIRVDYRLIHLGYFDNIEDAVEARNRANIKYGFFKNHGSKRPL